MRPTLRGAVAVTALCGALALAAPSALGAFGIHKWEAGTCTENTEAEPCTSTTTSKYYTQAAGHPPFGITDFELNTNKTTGAPEGKIKEVRVDIPQGLSVNPFATPRCKQSELESLMGCPLDTQVGEAKLKVHIAAFIPAEIKTPVYNMQPPEGIPLEADLKPAPNEIVHIVGGIDWSGDYHEFFTIKVTPGLAELVESRLIFFGTALSGGQLPFITMPSVCDGAQTTYLKVVSELGEEDHKSFTTGPPDLITAIGATGCEHVPFEPTITVTPSTTQSDQPDAATIEVKVPQKAEAASIDSSTLEDAHVTLPEGMTLNPSAASGLQSCTDAQFGKGTTGAAKCPEGSQVGTVTIETPNLPAKSLTGNVYVGEPLSSDPSSGGEYRIFMDAEAPAYGVSVRLEGKVSANPSTGQLTTAVLENPQVPFSDFIVSLSGAHAPLANPLVCGAAATSASSLLPYSANPPAANPLISFPIDFDGKGAGCPSPLPFAISQSATSSPATGGASTSFTLNLTRSDGNQYISKVATTLPPGLVGRIAAVTLCGEPQASLGTCPSASQIGTATVSVGSGPGPLTLSGSVYLTGPYAGAPFGLSVAVLANKIGPYSYGTIVTRASVSVDPYTSRVAISSSLPTIVGGVPLRLRSVTVDTSRPGFMLNPTNCGPLATNTALTSTFGSTQSISTPFQASGCGALPFNPRFTVSAPGRTSRANGAGLQVSVSTSPGEANISSVLTQLPRQLVSRLSTLNQACPEATFDASAAACPSGSRVGRAVAVTPVLPGKLTGPAVFVSHGNAAFPDLDIVLQGDGVTVILVGHTNIAGGITTSDFASVPDVPVSSFQLSLPEGRYSALSANGAICSPTVLVRKRVRAFRRVHGRRVPVFRRVHGRRVRVFKFVKRRRRVALLMPTTITGQNGKVAHQMTHIAVTRCPRARPHRRHRHVRHHHRRKHRRRS